MHRLALSAAASTAVSGDIEGGAGNQHADDEEHDSNSDDGDVPYHENNRIGWSRTLRRCIKRHTMPPVALGSREQNLTHKLKCLLHAIFLEAGPDEDDVRAFIASLVCSTSDWGTEAGLPDILNFHNLSDVVPMVTRFRPCDGENLVGEQVHFQKSWFDRLVNFTLIMVRSSCKFTCYCAFSQVFSDDGDDNEAIDLPGPFPRIGSDAESQPQLFDSETEESQLFNSEPGVMELPEPAVQEDPADPEVMDPEPAVQEDPADPEATEPEAEPGVQEPEVIGMPELESSFLFPHTLRVPGS